MNKHIKLIRDSIDRSVRWSEEQDELISFAIVSMGDVMIEQCDHVEDLIKLDLVLKIEQLIELNQPNAKKLMCKEKYDELFNKYLEILNS